MISVGRISFAQLPSHIITNGGSWFNASSESLSLAVRTPTKLKTILIINVLPTEFGMAFKRINLRLGGAA